jgi:hypothetical protein
MLFQIYDMHSDYVFDGTTPPYGPDDLPNPLQLYGKSKRGGELAISAVDGAKSVILRVPVLSVLSSPPSSQFNNTKPPDTVQLSRIQTRQSISCSMSYRISLENSTRWTTMLSGIPRMSRILLGF